MESFILLVLNTYLFFGVSVWVFLSYYFVSGNTIFSDFRGELYSLCKEDKRISPQYRQFIIINTFGVFSLLPNSIFWWPYLVFQIFKGVKQ